jgi:hypothetical protein
MNGTREIDRFQYHQNDKNPCHILRDAIRQVNDLFASLTEKFDIDFSEFDTFLMNDEPEIEKNLNVMWNRIDCDIFERYSTARLTGEELNRWQKELEAWKKKIMSAIRFFALKKYGQILDRPVSMLFVDIAA